MRTTYKIILILSLTLALTSCHNTITDLRGKVKFETYSITSKLPGRILKLNVVEGQQVKKGDTLAILDIPEVYAKQLQADGAMQAAEAQLQMAHNGATNEQATQIDSKLEAAKSQLLFAKESFERVQNMFKDSLIPAQQFDEVNMKLNMAKAQVKALEAKRKEVTMGARKELIAQAEGQLSRAKGAKEEVIIASDERYIIAPVNMSVETITLHEGELATPGYTLFNGYETSTLYFRFTISESKIHNYKIGQKITVTNPYTKENVTTKIIAIKQLSRYADITSTSPLYKLSETIYELKLVPIDQTDTENMYINSTVLIK